MVRCTKEKGRVLRGENGVNRLLVTAPLKHRVVWAEIDREARKGKPIPSDHAPLVIDLDSPCTPFDAGWSSAESRIASRLRK